jgi:hypothetical protein
VDTVAINYIFMQQQFLARDRWRYQLYSIQVKS